MRFALLKETGRRFRRDASGTIAVMFALALLPLVLFAGAALDYSRPAAITAASTALCKPARSLEARE